MKPVIALASVVILLSSAHAVVAYWSNNPIIPQFDWPTGAFLLALILYFGLGLSPDVLWGIDPSIGILMGSGLPMFSVPIMQRVSWVARACHFVPKVRFSSGRANFWIPSDSISTSTRSEGLNMTLKVLSPVVYESAEFGIDESTWKINEYGLLEPTNATHSSKFGPLLDTSPPSARDFLLFAAVHYHAFWEWEVRVQWKGETAFSTKGTDAKSLFDVHNEKAALPIVAAQLMRRPHSQSSLRAAALHEGDHEYGPYTLVLDSLLLTHPASAIDFHSYAAQPSKVIASLAEFAGAYYRVIQYIKQSSALPEAGLLAHVQVGQTLWIALLGGVTLDSGRLTIQNLPGRWGVRNILPDEAYLSRISSVLEIIKPYAKKESFNNLVYSGGSSRRPSLIFLAAGLCVQSALCFILSATTSAGVWMSVSLANAIMFNKLSDWHSMYWGKTAETYQPGMKMYVPGQTNHLAIATFDRTSPREGPFVPGTLLNAAGMLAAIVGSIFKNESRALLGLPQWQPPTAGILHTALFLAFCGTIVIAAIVYSQQKRERTWNNNSEFPLRCMVYATLFCSLSVSLLSLIFNEMSLFRLWPLLDIIVWLSGIPFGVLENSRMVSCDEGILQIMLLTRWIAGGIAGLICGMNMT